MNEIEKFWSKVNKTDDCWNWTAGKTNGYGEFIFEGKKWRTHRLSYTLTYGEIPVGLVVCHKCDNRSCVRPDHLFLGTTKDNMNDRTRKGRCAYGERNGRNKFPDRWPSINGEKNHQAKLTQLQVIEIRKLRKQGITVTEIAQRYGIGLAQVSRIVNNKRWSWVAE